MFWPEWSSDLPGRASAWRLWRSCSFTPGGTRLRWSRETGKFRLLPKSRHGDHMVVSSPARLRRPLIVSTLLLVLAGCALARRAQRVEREEHAPPPNDGNIAAMFLAANNTDISYAQVALTPGHATAEPVIAFAKRML